MTRESPPIQPHIIYVNRFGHFGGDSVITHTKKFITPHSEKTDEIGRTLLSGTEATSLEGSAVIMPTFAEIQSAECSKRDKKHEKTTYPNTFESPSLDAFIDEAKKYIQALLRHMGSRAMLQSQLTLAERTVHANPDSDGTIPHVNDNDEDFKGYVATTDEIDAMKGINRYANSLFALHNHEIASERSNATMGLYL